MALLTTLGLLASGANAVNGLLAGRSATREALKGLEAFERQDLVNAYENIRPSLDIENTALSRLSETRANVFDVAQGMNASNAMALVSSSEEALGQKELDIYNKGTEKLYQRDVMKAQDEAAMRGIQEQRDAADLASLQAELASGRQMVSDAVLGLGQMSMAAGLAREQRIAGAGVDPYVAAQSRIADGTAKGGDYLTTGDYAGYFKNLGMNISGFFGGNK